MSFWKTRQKERAGVSVTEEVVYGRRPVTELLKAGGRLERILVAVDAADRGIVTEIRSRATKAGVPVRVVPKAEIERLAPGRNHQGVVAIGAAFHYADYQELLHMDNACLLFADALTDPQNLGSLLRSADGAGFTGVVLPARRSVGVTAAVRRVAAGAAEVVPVARVPNLSRALDEARRAGLWIVGLAQGEGDALWTSELLEPPVGIVVGGEDRGISPGVRGHCDAFVQIPLAGRLESLNAGVAGAVAMFEVARRRDR